MAILLIYTLLGSAVVFYHFYDKSRILSDMFTLNMHKYLSSFFRSASVNKINWMLHLFVIKT